MTNQGLRISNPQAIVPLAETVLFPAEGRDTSVTQETKTNLTEPDGTCPKTAGQLSDFGIAPGQRIGLD